MTSPHQASLERQLVRRRPAACHGDWPNVREELGVVFRKQNVSRVSDMYVFQV